MMEYRVNNISMLFKWSYKINKMIFDDTFFFFSLQMRIILAAILLDITVNLKRSAHLTHSCRTILDSQMCDCCCATT